MTTPPNARRQGFTLVELLTVIGIISLLISILLPSLSKARDQAKKVADKAELDAIGKGLEMFQNDFNQYPDSSAGKDPIDWTQTVPSPAPPLPQPAKDDPMTGAHWMARAMIGHDFQGVDTQGVMLQRPPTGAPASYVPPKFDDFLNPTPAGTAGLYHERKGTYLDPKVFVRDDDPIKFPGATINESEGPNIRHLVVFDVYNFPVLYYRANSRAANAFGIDGAAATKGVYNQSDNAAWTGGVATIDGNVHNYAGTDFANSGSAHGIGKFVEGGSGNVPADYTGSNIGKMDLNATGSNSASLPYKGKTFVKYVHSENTHQSGNAAKAVNPDTFILISAGKDGVFGTDDDVNNFTGGL